MVSICKIFDFCASHKLYCPEWSEEENLRVFGKCANQNGHGHNYRLEVEVTGNRDTKTNMIIDAKRLKEIVEEVILLDVDHRNFNLDVEWMQGVIPTVEGIVEAIWTRLNNALQAKYPQLRLKQVKLWETPTIYASCYGE